MKFYPYQKAEDFCIAYGCPRNKFLPGRYRDVSFHRFPKDKDLRNKWTLSLQLTLSQPTTKSVVCSNHFDPDCFVTEIKQKNSRPRFCRSLKKDAVPSIPAIKLTLSLKQLPTTTLQVGCSENHKIQSNLKYLKDLIFKEKDSKKNSK